MKSLIDLAARLARIPIFLAGEAAILLTRVVLGLVFIGTGWGKLSNLDGTTQQFIKWGFVLPKLNAFMAGATELIGGTLILIGLGTRVGAAVLSGTMIVALLTADREKVEAALGIGHPSQEVLDRTNDLTDVTAAVYLIFMLWLVGFGGGKVALDRLLEFWWRRRHPGQPLKA